jgi:hypothetical protein
MRSHLPSSSCAEGRRYTEMDTATLTRRSDYGKARIDKGEAKSVPAAAKAAIEYLLDVENSLEKAAAHAGLKLISLKKYLQRTHIRRYLFEERQIRIDAARAGNVPALVKVRDHSENGMAIVAAAKAIEQLGAETDASGQPRSPAQSAGITIVIETPGASAKVLPPVIEHEPTAGQHVWPSVD